MISCDKTSDKETMEELIAATVEERLDRYRQIRAEKCLERVLEEANRLADSILIAEARLARDTMAKPPKPFRPDAPEIIALHDTTPIAPFLIRKIQDSLFQDSLFRDSLFRDSIFQDSIRLNR